MKTLVALLLCMAASLLPASSVAQQPPVGMISPSVEKRLKELPPGSLFWRIENFPTLAQAQAAAGPTGLTTEFSGKVWLFTLGPKDGTTPGATKVTEVGPLPTIQAPEYLLRIMNVKAPPGWRSSEHTHPGSESFYVLKGRVGHKSAHGTHYADAAKAMNSHGTDTPMQVFNPGDTDVELFAMFVVDATRPFSSPAKLD
jgi:quercetin dioxygenase-like cupin family protein